MTAPTMPATPSSAKRAVGPAPLLEDVVEADDVEVVVPDAWDEVPAVDAPVDPVDGDVEVDEPVDAPVVDAGVEPVEAGPAPVEIP